MSDDNPRLTASQRFTDLQTALSRVPCSTRVDHEMMADVQEAVTAAAQKFVKHFPRPVRSGLDR